MARMYSRKKGKSSSKIVLEDKSNNWIRYKPKEIEMLIVKLAKEDLKGSEIGLILRDKYGIPSVKKALGKKISQVLAEKKLLGELPEDLIALIKKSVFIRKHLEKNHKDMTAKRGLQLTESKIKRLVRYYKEKGKVDIKWKYDPERAKMFL